MSANLFRDLKPSARRVLGTMIARGTRGLSEAQARGITGNLSARIAELRQNDVGIRTARKGNTTRYVAYRI